MQKDSAWIVVIPVVIQLISLTGCATPTKSPPSTDTLIADIALSHQADSRRLAQLDELLTRPLTADQTQTFIETLTKITASPLHFPVIRRRAVDIITEHYPDHIAAALAPALPVTLEPDLQRYILTILDQHPDKTALPHIIITLDDNSDKTTIATSPYAKTAQHIAQKPLDDLLTDLLKNPDHLLPARAAALNCLVKHTTSQNTLAIIHDLPKNDPLCDSLKFWAKHFNYIPTNIPRLLTCQLQQSSLTDAQWQTLFHRADILRFDDNYPFNPRDTHLLLNIDPDLLDTSRPELIHSIAQRLASLDHTKRPPSYTGAPDDYPESFTAAQSQLAITDLLRLTLLLQTFTQPEILLQIRNFLDSDLHQIDSELGGLCFLDQNRIRFERYTTETRRGDHLFIESSQMTLDAALSLARWHCHVHPFRAAELAGPGPDDLRFIAYHNTTALVFTRLNDTIANIDYVTPEGIVIDCGNYESQKNK